jgi:ATP-dependent protease ClpP protease subunit
VAEETMMTWIFAKSSDDERTLHLTGLLDGLDEGDSSTRALVMELRAHPTKRVTVHVSSLGGSHFGGVALYNAFRSHGASVVAIINTIAGGAAAVAALGAGRVVMGPTATLSIESPWGGAWGDSRDLRHTADVLDKMQAGLIEIYSEKTKKSADELRRILPSGSRLFQAEEAKLYGFVDEVRSTVKNAAALAQLHAEAGYVRTARLIAGRVNAGMRRPW